MNMKKCVLVCLFLIFISPTSNALSSPVNFYWAYLFSNHSKDINGAIGYNMIVTVGVDSDSVAVTLDLPDKGLQIKLDPWGPYVFDPTYYEYGKVINDPPPGDWYKTSYRFLVDDGTSSPVFSHATNNIFPMDFVQADISGGKHPTISWEPVDFADRYNIRFFDPVTGERLFEEFIDEDGSTSYSYEYLGNLFEEHEKLRIRITARDEENGQIVNWSHVSYEYIVDSDSDGIPDGEDNCPLVSNNNQLDNDADSFGNVCDPDDDNDGMPDIWENKFGLNPIMNDASEDIDNDGISNIREYRGGSDPTDSNSIPQAKAMPWIPLLLLND